MFHDVVDREAPPYVRDVLAEHSRAVLTRLREPDQRVHCTDEPVVISVVKDECDRLADFLRHYREAGIEQFFFIDNGSSDGTVEFLCDQRDCRVWQIKKPFDWRRKQGWITLAIDIIGRARNMWYIYADADEHIVFDRIGGETFGDFCRRMDGMEISRVRGVLIDMYRDGPLLGSTYAPGSRLLSAYPFFDGTGYKEQPYRELISRKGGARQRIFGGASAEFRPEMSKYPIFKLSGHDVFANPHHIWPYDANRASPCFLGLLHFKFLPDTLERIEAAIKSKSYWNGSIEYKCYQDILARDPSLSLMGDVSRKYVSPDSLLEAGIICATSSNKW